MRTSSPALVLGSFYHFLERREQWGYLLRRNCQNAQFSKMNGLLSYWEEASPDLGSWEPHQSCPLSTKASKFQMKLVMDKVFGIQGVRNPQMIPSNPKTAGPGRMFYSYILEPNPL